VFGVVTMMSSVMFLKAIGSSRVLDHIQGIKIELIRIAPIRPLRIRDSKQTERDKRPDAMATCLFEQSNVVPKLLDGQHDDCQQKQQSVHRSVVQKFPVNQSPQKTFSNRA